MRKSNVQKMRQMKALAFALAFLLGEEEVFGADLPSKSSSFATLPSPHASKEKPVILSPLCRVFKGCRNGAIYMSVYLPHPDTLLKASVPLEIADRVELHTHQEKDGILKMVSLETFPIPSGILELKPGKDHLMVIGLNKTLTPGDKIPLSLTFEKAGILKLEVLVEGADWQRAALQKQKKICTSCAEQ